MIHKAEMKKGQRMLIIVSWLLSKRYVKTSEIMETFEKTRQTALNDLSDISEIIPLGYDSQKHHHFIDLGIADPSWASIIDKVTSDKNQQLMDTLSLF